MSNDLSTLPPRSISRRGFVQASAIVGATVLGSGLLVSLAGCSHEKGEEIFQGTRTITDHAGRELKVPVAKDIERVYFTSSLAQIFIYTLNPDIMAGTTSRFGEEELAMLPERMRDLRWMGSFSENGELDKESLLAEGVQVVFSISAIELSESNISEAEQFQSQTDIPTVLVDGSFENISEAYRFLGDILGVEKRAEELASYMEDVYANVTSAVSKVPESERVSLYYAEGPMGLQSEPSGSQHALAFDVAGARNVVDVPEVEGMGMSNVSLEQILAWDPDVIIAWSEAARGGADNIIRERAEWSTLKAVKNGRVYTMPNVPFAWCDRPSACNRYLGMQWVANMLYPDAYDVDMVEVAKDFYSRCYWIDLTDEQAKELLANSYPPYRA